MSLVAPIIVLASVAQASPPPPPALEPPTAEAADEGGFAREWPLFLSHDLHPETEEQLAVFWAFPFFINVWLPAYFDEDGDRRRRILLDGVVTTLWHAAPHLVLYVLQTVGVMAALPVVAISFFVAIATPAAFAVAYPLFFVVFCLNAACVLGNLALCAGNALYCYPVALANNHDRIMKAPASPEPPGVGRSPPRGTGGLVMAY